MDHCELSKKWLAKLTKLNAAVGRGDCRGKAPHKPLLILCILDLVENGEFFQKCFSRSPGLVLRFKSYGSIVADRWPSRLDIRLPFFYLKSQGFWNPLDSEKRQAQSPEYCVACEMHPEFFRLIEDREFRINARILLLTKYFEPVERIAFFESLGIDHAEPSIEVAKKAMQDAENFAKRKGRSAKFSVRVCSEYRYTCALTGYRCVTGDGSTIVDAAHIVSWAESQNDDPYNGLALSKNAHWLFDQGLWSVDDQYRIIVNERRFTEEGSEMIKLASRNGKELYFDSSSKMRPSLEYIRKHRKQFKFI